MELGRKAEQRLAEKRVQVRLTLLGPAESGKTQLINAFVNNTFDDSYTKTEFTTLYYAVLSTVEEDAKKDAPKFNTLIEIEDTEGSDTLGKDVNNFFDPHWPKEEKMAEKRPPNDEKEHGEVKRSCHLPFSMLHAPVGTHNDEDREVERCTEGIHEGKYFCKQPEHRREHRCGPKEKNTQDNNSSGRQCPSCRRFQKSINPPGKLPVAGQYMPFVKERMAYLFVFDATDKDSYMKAMQLFEQYQAYQSKRLGKKRQPLLYFVGTKTDLSTEPPEAHKGGEDETSKSDMHQMIVENLRDFARRQSEKGTHLQTPHFVSAAQFKNVTKLFKTIMMDLRLREPLWKLHTLEENPDGSTTADNCGLQ